MISRDLEIAESEMPFAGELLKVREEDQSWEGAAERVLHNFGLSVIVPEEHYKRVSAYVDRTNLKGRIVYYKVPVKAKYDERKEVSATSLANKIEIKSDTRFFDWLRNELVENFNFECCETIDLFQRETKRFNSGAQADINWTTPSRNRCEKLVQLFRNRALRRRQL